MPPRTKPEISAEPPVMKEDPMIAPRGVSDGGADAPEGRHGAADRFGDAVGQERDRGGEHHVEADHAQAVVEGEESRVAEHADAEEGDAAEDAAQDDPGGALSEARARAIGEIAEEEVGDERDDRRDRIDRAEERIGVGDSEVLEALGEQYGGDDRQADRPQEGDEEESRAESEHRSLRHRLMGVGSQGGGGRPAGSAPRSQLPLRASPWGALSSNSGVRHESYELPTR